MHSLNTSDTVRLARYTGWAFIATIVIGILTAVFVVEGIDINLNADVEATARNMLEAESRLRAKAYIAILVFALEVFISLGLFVVLEKHGRLLAAWSALISVSAALYMLLGAMFAMNAAVVAGDPAYQTLTSDSERLFLAGLQATSDYTSFHLGLVMSSLGKAGFFYLFVTSAIIPRVIAAWGLFASLLVVFMIVSRDFIPALANNTLSIGFILANLVAMVVTGLYLSVKGVRTDT